MRNVESARFGCDARPSFGPGALGWRSVPDGRRIHPAGGDAEPRQAAMRVGRRLRLNSFQGCPNPVSDRVGRGFDRVRRRCWPGLGGGLGAIKPVSEGLERGDGAATRRESRHELSGNQHAGQPWQGRCGCVRATSGACLLVCGTTIHVSPARGRTRRRVFAGVESTAKSDSSPATHAPGIELVDGNEAVATQWGSAWEGWEWTVTDGREGPAGPASGRSRGSAAEQRSPRPGSTVSGCGG